MATGTGNLPNPSMTFSPFAILTAEEMNDLVDNIEALATGSGIGDGAVPFAKTSGIWFEELGRTTLGAAGNTIGVSFTPKKHLYIIFAAIPSGVINARLRFNNDTGNNYSERIAYNGAVDGTGISASSLGVTATASATFRFGEIHVVNFTGQEKVIIGDITETGTAGAGNTTNRAAPNGKWANTAAQISSVQIVNIGAGTFAVGSECIVLGRD